MTSILRETFKRFCGDALRRLASTQGGREKLERQIFAALRHLGVGGGTDVEQSGEKILIALLRENAPQDRALCIIDAGANQGQFLRLMCGGLRGLAHHVHSFEPSAATFAMLEENAVGEKNVSLNNVGLGKAAGTRELFTDAVGSGMASLYNRRLDHFGRQLDQKEIVRLTTLDDYCAENDITQIDLLKMDVEGHELDVLQGASRMFAEQRVTYTTFEFGGSNIDSRTFVQDFYYFFKAHGMKAMYRILPTGDCQEIFAYRESLEQFVTTNFLVRMK